MTTVDVRQRIQKLEGLLARVQERRQLPRATAGNGQALEAAPASAPANIDEFDEVVDLADDDFIEIGDSVPPPEAAQPDSFAAEPPPAAQTPAAQAPTQPMPVLTLTEFDGEQAGAPRAAASSIPPAPDSGPAPARSEPAQSGSVSSRPPRAEPPRAQPDYGLDFDDLEEEEPPASSRRPIASSMDEALAGAALREAPLKTPPPESGPQEAPTGAAARAGSSASGLPEPDEESLPGDQEAERVSEGLPTSAQLGAMVSLEEGSPLDVEVRGPSEPAQPESIPPSEDFEVRLPEREPAGSYDAALEAPPEAQLELKAHRERTQRTQSPAPARSMDDDMEVVERPPATSSNVTLVTGAPQRYRPGSFLELLDASLKLGQK